MKKFLLLLAGIALVSGASAQLSWGIKTGMNISNLRNSPQTTMKGGMYVGAFFEYRLGSIFSLQPELVYSNQGGTRIWVDGEVTSRERIRINYAILPVMAKIYILKDLSFDLGPQAGYVLSAKTFDKIIDKTDGRAVWRVKRPIDRSTFNAFDFSVAAGFTYKLTFGLRASLRYSYGVTAFSKTDDWRNNVIQAGFQFGF